MKRDHADSRKKVFKGSTDNQVNAVAVAAVVVVVVSAVDAVVVVAVVAFLTGEDGEVDAVAVSLTGEAVVVAVAAVVSFPLPSELQLDTARYNHSGHQEAAALDSSASGCTVRVCESEGHHRSNRN